MNDRQSMRDLSDEYLRLIGGRKLYPPLNGYSAFLQGSEYNTQKYYKKWYEDTVRFDLFVHMKEGYSQVWLPEDDMRRASEFGFREYLRDPVFFERRGVYMSESIRRLDALYARYTYNTIKSVGWDTLIPLVNEVRDIMWDVNATVVFTIYLDKQLCTDILEGENFQISDDAFNTLWDKATEPAFESFDKAQLIKFLTLAQNGTPWNEVIEACQYMLTDYHSARTLSEVELVLRERYADYLDNPQSAARALTLETEQVDAEVAAHEVWLQSLPENERTIAYYLQTVMRVRDRRKNFFAQGMTILYRIAERMFDEAKVERDLIPYYTVHELLRGTTFLEESAATLRDRTNGFQWLVPYVGEVQGYSRNIDPGVENINRYYTESHTSKEQSDTIKGQSGFKGVVRGRVRIVLNVQSDHGFVEGEILVAGMTRPEYVPLMKKALAIITDEGGITCHAAIVARELKKPCIIGTKIATRVLHDGDLVEVDADSGMVRVIERASE
jgi:phosphohistidine swiveling domain-containing protein